MDQFHSVLHKQGNHESLIQLIQHSIIGRDLFFTTPLGFNRQLVYSDYFASGRSLSIIEDVIRDSVLPFYANTHTTSTFTGRYMTEQREKAREAIHRSVGAPKSQYAVVFTGSGSTSAISHLALTLGLYNANKWPQDNPPVVFVSIMEHHSNILPWRESQARVITIPMNDKGTGPDLTVLEHELINNAHAPLLIGSFSAGSNLTGVSLDVKQLCLLLHRYNASSCFDFAGVAPYVPINMADLQATAIFLSPHKFVGGPGTPGVLIVDRQVLLANKVPIRPGGGSVSWVSLDHVDYVDSLEEREEAGTPDIIGSIRAGMVFALKDTIGAEAIQAKEFAISRSILNRLQSIPNLYVLGDTDSHRVPVFSFVIFSPYKNDGRPLLLHHDYVSTLLNDIFGIQSRSGCMCAALYGQFLLGKVVIPAIVDCSHTVNQVNLCPLTDDPQSTQLHQCSPTKVPPLVDDELPQPYYSPEKQNSLCPFSDNSEPPSRADSGILSDLTSIHSDASSIESSESHGPTWPLSIFKPGYIRLCFNYFTAPHEVDYTIRAVQWVAQYGHLLLPYYCADPLTGEWTVRTNVNIPNAESGTSSLNPVDQSLNSSAFADADRLMRPDSIKKLCEFVHFQAETELDELNSLARERPLNARRFAIASDTCHHI